MVTLEVLVVDDEPGMRLGVVRALHDYTVGVDHVNGEVGFSVRSAESGEEALDLIQAAPPHILIVDHKLPGMTGLELLERVRARSLDTLVIVVTAYASIETAVQATKSGAYDFLAKPFTPAELRKVVGKAAEHIVLARQARQLARERREIRFQFISVLTHELRAPLDAVEGYLEIIKNRTAGDDPAVYERMIDRCITRIRFMRKMVVDLLDLTRIESGQRRREPALLDVREVAVEAIETALPDAREMEVEIALHAPDPVPLVADRSELEIVFNNLISNAVKYNRRGGRVDVHLSATDDAVTIAVRDTGIGMTAEEASRLFEDFVRIRNPKTHGIFGSGLGLSIVKKLATLYGGAVSVESAPDAGSTFTVTLPRATPSEEPEAG